MMYKYNEINREVVRRQWKQLLEGKEVDDTLVRPDVIQLWKEAKSLGIDPVTWQPEYLSKDEFDQRIAENRKIIDAAMPFLRNLYENIHFSYSLVVLADHEGVPLVGFTLADNPRKSNYNLAMKCSIGITPESAHIFTPEYMMCLRTKKPSWSVNEENYLMMAKNWSSTAAPILDEDNNVLGLISLSDEDDVYIPHSMGIVTSAAKAISNELKMRNANRKLQNTAAQLHATLESIPFGIAVVDRNGTVSNVNKRFLTLLSIQEDTSSIIGKTASDIMPTSDDVFGEFPFTSAEKEVLIGTAKGNQRFFYSAKPFSYENDQEHTIITLKEGSYAQQFAENLPSAKAHFTFDDIVGSSDAMIRQKELCKVIANSPSTVLITGPSGTGKELFAQAIHSASTRRDKPFISINCGALPNGLVESELFGYEGGSFTGAKRNGQVGKFELANHGTLFLDEIGEMPLSIQTSLLRVLQTREITRIGGKTPTSIDVRIIAATNRNLNEAVVSGQFREDLYYRLNVINISVPPLKDRKDDLSLLLDRFLSQYCASLGKNDIRFSDEAMTIMENYDWPGNVRELENTVERVVNIFDSGTTVTPDLMTLLLPAALSSNQTSGLMKGKPLLVGADSLNMQDVEEQVIVEALQKHRANMTKTAQELGISRRTLYAKCEFYGIDYLEYR